MTAILMWDCVIANHIGVNLALVILLLLGGMTKYITGRTGLSSAIVDITGQ